MSLPAPFAVHLPVGVLARLDPDNAQARRWLAEELARAPYSEHNDPISRLLDAIKRAIDDLLTVDPSTSTVLPPLVAGAITAAVVAGLLLSLRYVRREARARTAPAAVLGSERLTAAQFRSRSGLALAQGRYAAAVVDAMRAIAQSAAERTLLEETPSLTAHEIALGLLDAFPAHGPELRWAADLFDSVAYGRLDAERQDAERIIALEAVLARTRPAARAASGHQTEGALSGAPPAGGPR